MSEKEFDRTNDDAFETEIRILPDGAVVILDLDEQMLDLALALNPNDFRLRRRRRLLRRKVRRFHETEQNR
ncbi:hypothetical protein Q2T83_09860 [Fervidibacter sacchari]|uniref:Uncharacterized protein n=1 Tax=Candidatus Fervidibacter sacchari TaxID=1448929 RepID=A0ABT2ESJ5_9BACT|nr:hypothetical protein [Candidatus Fervidibacter sacchari]MCS3920396.1 hypothetical protein [Candidatus Fervidibacter sacchari]WKU14644.1 hypothetical protein Q2T83_09860 [Candidatus Fervidibacter sacchari]